MRLDQSRAGPKSNLTHVLLGETQTEGKQCDHRHTGTCHVMAEAEAAAMWLEAKTQDGQAPGTEEAQR